MRRLVAELRELLHEQLEYRELLVQMTKRDLMLRYKQTVMGFGWAVFMPLVNTAVFSVIFTRVAPIETPVPYPVFAFCGLWVWNFFASSLRFAVSSLTSNMNLVSKVYFPREILPFSSVLVCLIDFAVGGLVLAAMMIFYGIPVGLQLLWLPIVLGVHVAFTVAIALWLSMANLFYRDVKYLFEVAVSVWMFGTSVLYPLDQIGGRSQIWLLFNPMTPIVDAYRAVLLLQEPPPATLAWAAGLAVVGLVAAWVSFHRAEFQFAENI